MTDEPKSEDREDLLGGLQPPLEKWVLNPRWRTLHQLGEARVLGVSAFALIAVPLLARLIVMLRDWADLGGPVGQKIAQGLQLPNVMELLWVSALLALIGKLIYELACPAYIKCGPNYSNFRHSYTDALLKMAEDFSELWTSSDPNKKDEIKRIIHDALVANLITESSTNSDASRLTPYSVVRLEYENSKILGERTNILKPLASLLRRPDFGEEIFVVLRRMRDESRRPWRILCTFCYYAAIALTGWVILTQSQWVIRAM